MTSADAGLLFAGNGLVIAAMWLRHGGLDREWSPATVLTAAGQLSALLGTYLVLVALLFVARTPFLDQLFGDRAARYHRLVGIGAIVLLCAHVVCTVAGFALADGIGPAEEFGTQVLTYPFMLAGFVAFALFLVVGASSIRAIRRRLSFETWQGLHLYAYLAAALAVGQQLAVGSDFTFDPLARWYWSGLYAAVVVLIAAYRVASPVALQARHRFRVEAVVREGPGVVSIHVGGRDLDRLAVRAGQYFRLRLLIRNEWWRSHPFSISAAPDGRSLRFTVKALGDFSSRLQSLGPGARVMLEGPCGALTGARRSGRGVVLIGGGIGITPMRALFEELARQGDCDVRLLYRASRREEVVFESELAALERLPRASVTYLVGRRGSPAMPADPLQHAALRRLVPDIAERDVFICGPEAMTRTVEDSLRELGVPAGRVHSERFAA